MSKVVCGTYTIGDSNPAWVKIHRLRKGQYKVTWSHVELPRNPRTEDECLQIIESVTNLGYKLDEVSVAKIIIESYASNNNEGEVNL